MDKSIFNYSDYKHYLNEWIASKPSKGRGFKGKIAERVGCHNTFVTQVLSGTAHFSLEQAERLNGLLGHTDEEARFFLTLVQIERAGTHTLKRFFETEKKELLNRRAVLRERLDYDGILKAEDQAHYYSGWEYAAIHMAVSIEGLNTRDALVQKLLLAPNRVSEVLTFLESRGFIELRDGRYYIGQTSIHLGSDSPMIRRHHQNWRLQAMRDIEGGKESSLHYSSLATLSREDFLRVREVLVKAIENSRSIIRPSQNEVLCAYSIDFYEPGLSEG